MFSVCLSVHMGVGTLPLVLGPFGRVPESLVPGPFWGDGGTPGQDRGTFGQDRGPPTAQTQDGCTARAVCLLPFLFISKKAH